MKAITVATIFLMLAAGCHASEEAKTADATGEVQPAKRTVRQPCEIHGSVGKPVCSFSMTEVVLGQVPEGYVRLTGILAEVDGETYLFSSSESATAKNIGDAVYVDAIDDEIFEEHPDMFLGKIVIAVGSYSLRSHRVESSAFSSAGTLTISSIRHFN